MTALNITARRWSGGWELWNDDDCWTQVAHLADARQQVVDYLDTVDEGTDHSGWDVTITPDVSSAAQVKAARQATERAALLQKEAASAWREAAIALRAEGLSVSDTAAVMGVSRGRVSQLTATA
ncbi:antitoxin HicB [Actinomyces urogenitalis]|uniref:antitoxin HicB n=1 Tax=Actinomyces urogenitalis TaxID=103621 RepID=UPI000660A3BE|nr:antitoxin HicB [Actinomyces urogenitalis]